MKKWSVDLPHITNKQKQIMELIYKFRFLNRIQIQTLMKHKDYKRINVWLKDLVEKDYLYRIYERKIPLNIKPAVYFLAPTGVRFTRVLGDWESSHKLYREKERSVEFRNKCLLLADLYIDIFKKTEALNALNFFNTKQDIPEYDGMIEPYPDALISLNKTPTEIIKSLNKKSKLTTKGNTKKRKHRQEKRKNYLYFLEIIGNKVPRYYLRYRIQQYIEYSDRNGPVEPKSCVLFSCPNELTQKFLLKFIKTKLEKTLFDPHLLFFATTTDQSQSMGILAGIWEEAKE